MKPRRILIIGGTGVFGKRLVRHLVSFKDIELYVSSRSAAKAENLLRELRIDLPVHGVALDSRVNLQERLEEIKPFIVVNCSGPFQGANYDTAKAVITSGAHLIDLADARDYLVNFATELNGLARDYKVSALTGASSTPTLSTCVVDHLTADWQRVDTVDMCITPGGKSEVGRSVIEAIMSYAGREIPVWKNGELANITGWSNARSVHIPKLGKRRVAAVETFDAEYLGEHFNVTSRVTFAAGLESRIEQLGIETIAFLRKRGLFSDLKFLIPLLLKARRITRLPTSDEGGMFVEIRGLDAKGVAIQGRWSLVAKRDHGPFIPILPAAAAIEKLLTEDVASGANFAHGELVLEDVIAQMAPYDISTEDSFIRTETSTFERVLGERFHELPDELQKFHASHGPVVWSGKADITGGKGIIANLIARLFGFPDTGKNIPVTVTIDRSTTVRDDPSETWTRSFAGKEMSSVLRASENGSVTEKFAPFTFILLLGVDQKGIEMPVSSWKLGSIPLPRFLAPRSQSLESVDAEGRFQFDVKLSIPVIGLLAHYRGWLEPKL